MWGGGGNHEMIEVQVRLLSHNEDVCTEYRGMISSLACTCAYSQ